MKLDDLIAAGKVVLAHLGAGRHVHIVPAESIMEIGSTTVAAEPGRAFCGVTRRRATQVDRKTFNAPGMACTDCCRRFVAVGGGRAA